jgi:hypothetical protein
MAPGSMLRLVEIAELLGVSKQRAHQLADDPGFPARIERATAAAECGIGARSRRGPSSGAPRSRGAEDSIGLSAPGSRYNTISKEGRRPPHPLAGGRLQ